MLNKLENTDLRSEEVQEILSKIPHWMIRWGSILFLILLVLVIALTWFIKYPDVINSKAIVTTKIPPQKEYAQISGKIDELLVLDNELVNHGQPLAILENTANFEDVFFLKSIIDTIKPNNISFQFPIDSIPILFLGEIDLSFALFENSYIQYLINKKLQPFSNESSANQYILTELTLRLGNLDSQKRLNADELALKKKDLQRNKILFEKGVISEIDYENKQLEYLQAERSYQNLNVSVSQIREAISNANRNKKGNEINRVKEEMILLKNVIQTFNQLKKSVKDWEHQYVLKSNIEGQVSFLNYWRENQSVNLGDLVFTIIPSQNSSFIAKLKTPVQNSGKIKLGQRVNVKLENYPDTEFGTITGVVENISLLPDDNGLYLIDVALPKELITSYNKEIDFKQEMQGVAEIITEDLRLIERFFYQLKSVFDR